MSILKQEQLLRLAWQIVDQLEAEGHEAYLVGGYVRDQLLGRSIKDIDIATSARPEVVLALFRRVEPTGLQHGTCTVIVEGQPFEVTTFRSEAGYTDHRRPDEVRFIRDLREDLSRRDFTMNAMAMSRAGELIDPFGGASDLEGGILRTVGDPNERFGEDALRMLRCIRFAAEYGLMIEPRTWQALLTLAPRIASIAAERIRAELERIIEGQAPARGMAHLSASRLLVHVKLKLPESLTHCEQILEDGQLDGWVDESEPAIRWARLFLAARLSAAEAVSLMRRLTFPNRKSQAIARLIAIYRELETELAEHESANRTGEQLQQGHIQLQRAWKLLVIRCGVEAADLLLRLLSSQVQLLAGWSTLLEHGEGWLRQMPITSSAELAIKGDQLLEAGLTPGPALGRLITELVSAVALGELPNDQQILLMESLRRQSGR